jgi:hypothetical protein
MTRGDFILGVVSSLVATVLFELARKFYPRLQNIPFKELISRFLKTALALKLLLVYFFKKLVIENLSIRVLSYSFALAISFITLVKVPLYRVYAPSPQYHPEPIYRTETVRITPGYLFSTPPEKGSPYPVVRRKLEGRYVRGNYIRGHFKEGKTINIVTGEEIKGTYFIPEASIDNLDVDKSSWRVL